MVIVGNVVKVGGHTGGQARWMLSAGSREEDAEGRNTGQKQKDAERRKDGSQAGRKP